MVQSPPSPAIAVVPFDRQLQQPLSKLPVTVLQINLGRKCNLACTHCHVEAGPRRTEELSPQVADQLIQLIRRFPQITTVDLTGGAPEMNYGFRPLVEAARGLGKQVIVRSNLTIFFVLGFEDLPEYFARHQLHVVASLPCYLEDNVDQQRGAGVYSESIKGLQRLNQLGYGQDPHLQLDLVYNPPVPRSAEFSLTPSQAALQGDYTDYLRSQFDITFNQLFTITNLPIGRVKQYLQGKDLYWPYLHFLAAHHNPATVAHLMCRQQLSVDYNGVLYDCDFNQMEAVPCPTSDGQPLTVADLLAADSLDLVEQVQTRDYCYGCTAGSGSSCGGALT
ncbi:arsenosugar biosynthesis radical SAM protein ArsS [Nodosilinea sp. LEGE 07088]|uniref:arsenosugar biosynthesis radical SAM (seleno)protein ArsS n=1 Tax=Nodosilinea sp. LEGE 07088 TaxID=2777968 RepID=UPI001880CD67|nr:arsenosugar biosynthesis radical SAM (seleno)protein ArsS [Nodosilinea sp. LEGE 07088]MBE9141310.1 arsenosugar biosynthesis radical SAM protein ArsS [Nodosilinea sp. LEGE 07088]